MTKIAIIGEAWGEQEERERTPFVGYAGLTLNKMLQQAGIERYQCLVTNVFQLCPASNDIRNLCGDKEEAIPGYPKHEKGYIRSEFGRELDRLARELLEADPNCIICLGATALWAMLGQTKIGKYRGVTATSTHTATGFKCLPTYHPQAVNYVPNLRATTVIDLQKAKREAEFPEIRRPSREIWIEPLIEDLHEFDRQYLCDAEILAVDIETAGSQITCIGFAPTPRVALVIPFYDGRRKDRNYWASKELERHAWEFISDVLSRRGSRKLFQNGLYDIAFLWRANRVRVVNAAEDTMLLHHALQPESLKSLAFLGSIYTDEGLWKTERTSTIGAEK